MRRPRAVFTPLIAIVLQGCFFGHNRQAGIDGLWPKSFGADSGVCANLRPIFVEKYEVTERRNRLEPVTRLTAVENAKISSEAWKSLVMTRNLCGLRAAGALTTEQFAEALAVAGAPEAYLTIRDAARAAGDTALVQAMERLLSQLRPEHSSSDADALAALGREIATLRATIGPERASLIMSLSELRAMMEEQRVLLAGAPRPGADGSNVGGNGADRVAQALVRIEARVDTVARALAILRGPTLRDLYTPLATVVVMFDEAATEPNAQQLLQLDAALAQYRGQPVLFSLVGAADQRGARSRNAALSRARADAVARWLLEKYDVPPAQVSIAALGATTRFGADQAANRRVTVYVLGTAR
ncbi:OmpA family protein [Gemmatimonas sp. UBA7669]|uniref:OmpA family protein n=1 Tax=Gemmatimonas sp. UBA7669 TaxID=1946568 RepID=UPI0025C36E11|nr:OmpA family protein [Gemmatimonas sp. UBA7669]